MDDEDNSGFYYQLSLFCGLLGLLLIIVGVCFLTQSWICGYFTMCLGIIIFVVCWCYIHNLNMIEKLELVTENFKLELEKKNNNDLKNDLKNEINDQDIIYPMYPKDVQKFNDFSPGKVTDHDHNKKI